MTPVRDQRKSLIMISKDPIKELEENERKAVSNCFPELTEKALGKIRIRLNNSGYDTNSHFIVAKETGLPRATVASILALEICKFPNIKESSFEINYNGVPFKIIFRNKVQ